MAAESAQPDDTPLGRDVAETLHRIEEHLAAIRNGSDPAPREWQTIQDVADQLQVSRDTVERLIGTGRLKASEIKTRNGHGHRHRYRIRREWLEEFLLESVTQQQRTQRTQSQRRYVKPQRDFIG